MGYAGVKDKDSNIAIIFLSQIASLLWEVNSISHSKSSVDLSMEF
jgi:hypothetical protein